MSYKKHIWRNRYRTPLPIGSTITAEKPGRKIYDCLHEIRSVVTDLKRKTQPAFTLTQTLKQPGSNTSIKSFQPGEMYSNVITELQFYVDSLLVKPHKWVYRYNQPAMNSRIHVSRPGWRLAKAITELQDVIDTIGAHALLDIYNEHRRVLSQSAVATATLAEMQAWMETYCTSFIDHIDGPLNATGDEFLFFTLSKWRTVAGIDGSWQNGDEARGFNALRWTIEPAESFDGLWKLRGRGASDWTCQEAVDDLKNEWLNMEWRESSAGYYMHAIIEKYFEGHRAEVARGKAKYKVENLYNGIFSHALFYGLGKVTNETFEFFDGDGIGLLNEKYALIQDLGSSNSTYRETGVIGDSDEFPIDSMEMSCPISEDVKRSCTMWLSYFLLKWDFTQA